MALVQGELKYTIPAAGNNFTNQGLNVGVDVDAILTYDAASPNPNGTYTVIGASGTYNTVDVSGNVVSHDLITGVGPLESYAVADNRIDVRGVGHYFVDGGGLALNIDHPGDTLQGTGTANLYVPGSDSYAEISGGNLVNSISFNGMAVGPVGDIPVCFASGTRIATERGEVAVEDLVVGDSAVTTSGSTRPIIWIGHRKVDCRTGDPRVNWPVRVTAGAFGPGRPARDLYLSPQHAVAVTCLDEVLIPVKYLINGATIAQVPVEEVTYWHVELDGHDLLLAEGLAAESFLDTQGRIGFFDNGAEHAAAHPDLPLKGMDEFCRPLILDGPVIDAVRGQLIAGLPARGWTLDRDPDLHLMVDGVRIDPLLSGSLARFVVPAAAQEVRIRSRSFVPEQIEAGSRDGRRLGVPLKRLAITDGLDVDRAISIDDEQLETGLSYIQRDGEAVWRWTDGDTPLPPRLWDGARGQFFLRLDLAPEGGSFRCWTAPTTEVSSAREASQLDDPAERTSVVAFGPYRARAA